jgi:hypothetical protein
VENEPSFCPALHAVENIQRTFQAFFFAEKYNIALHAGVVIDNGFKVFVK